jgi:hypothetical protein
MTRAGRRICSATGRVGYMLAIFYGSTDKRYVYVYLADLAYAEANRGKTFTGIDWQFYKFGPWSQTVNDRIEPALVAE